MADKLKESVWLEGEPLPNGQFHYCCVCGLDKVLPGKRLRHSCAAHAEIKAEVLARAGLATPCVHLRAVTGELVDGCGCSIPEWQRQYHGCKLHGQCVLLKLAKRPAVRNCETCPDNPAIRPTKD